MNLFLRRLLLFICLLIIATGILLLALIHQVNKKECFVLKPGPVETIFLGFSHVEFNINDSLIPNARNLGDQAEPFFYTWHKASRIFDSNHGIKNVFIEFSNKSVNGYMDSTIFESYYMSRLLPQYATVLNGDDYGLLLRHSAPQLVSALSMMPRETLLAFKNREKDVMKAKKWGGFSYQKESKVFMLLEQYRNGHPRPFLDNEMTKYNLVYLQKLIALCKNEGKQVWLFSSPIHAASGDRANDSLFQAIRKTRFGDLPYLDMRNLHFPDAEYRDLEHLNGMGARRFSLYLNKLLQEPALYQDGNYQELINKTWASFKTAD